LGRQGLDAGSALTLDTGYVREPEAKTQGRGIDMGEHNSGPEEGIKGVVEGVKGTVKEAVGAVTGKDDLQREGQAQQDKADAQRDAAKKEAEAESARGAAKSNEERQKAEQN
jgi:uncharacterized protein YjbJ (UPF0337 family)